ncbi:MAG: dihydroorotase [Chitinophagales bacterium]|nr:dihydroorotase [Chitinophagales bacterium]MCZ2393350.1 dihydroorotase [Chitinophagales bacterium]
MRYRLNNVEIIDPSSEWNRKRKDICIIDGIISEADDTIQVDSVLQADGWSLIPGLCETYASISDPGFEYREDIESITRAALSSGITAVCAIADNYPVTQHKTHVEYLVNNTKGKIVEIWPIGAITEDLKGKNPTEMMDMAHAGAVAFSDAPHSVENSGVMMRALQYAIPFDGIIFSSAFDEGLAGDGLVNEGLVSVNMGVKGIPHLAESLRVYRDLQLLEYTGGRLHFCGINTEDGIRQVREAKSKGLNVTASVYLHHLLLDESQVENFDTNYKVLPPLRTINDVHALRKAVKEGVIDIISSQHIPLDTESKRLEFEYASPGMANIEFALSLALEATGNIETVIQTMSIAPRKLFRKQSSVISKGELANMVLVDLNEVHKVSIADRKSKSANSPFYESELKGVVKAVFNNGKIVKNE